ncbi:MAG: serine/threonine protein kinase [bacterium]|nr:serine/threonine protein kinase [bacterium]
MTAEDDVRFLALLVHRGHLARERAEPLLRELKGGAALDELLVNDVGWDDAKVQKMRRTRGGEEPEIPGYEFLGRLGLGGTAEVFRVREKKTGRSLALKILNGHCTQNPSMLKDFVSEARLLEKLDHPGLVRGHGVAKSGGTYFSRLELIEGSTLLELQESGTQFPEDGAMRIILEVAEVLKYMADNNLVHRDVKPGNIMLDQNGRVRLIDLGFCAAQNTRSMDDSAAGTVQYLSPEQAEGGAAADLRSDIYSLGVTLFQLIIGKLPFEGEDDQDTLRKHVMESLSSRELKSRGLSPHLHYFIEKMMAKDAEVRYQSWDELTADIKSNLEGRDSLDYSKDLRPKSGVFRRPPTRRG